MNIFPCSLFTKHIAINVCIFFVSAMMFNFLNATQKHRASRMKVDKEYYYINTFLDDEHANTTTPLQNTVGASKRVADKVRPPTEVLIDQCEQRIGKRTK